MIEILQEADRRVFVIDVGNMPPTEAIQYTTSNERKHLDYKI